MTVVAHQGPIAFTGAQHIQPYALAESIDRAYFQFFKSTLFTKIEGNNRDSSRLDASPKVTSLHGSRKTLPTTSCPITNLPTKRIR